MSVFYSIFIPIYGITLHIASLFHKKSAQWVKLRAGWEKSLMEKIEKDASYIWLHCASAGEFEQAIPLINNIKRQDPQAKIAVSFFSPSGYLMYRNFKLADLYFNIPLDTPQNARKIIKLLQPKAVIFVRNELWRNLLLGLKKNKIPAYLVNYPASKQTTFLYKKYLQNTLPLFTKVFDTLTFGNTKLERVKNIQEQAYTDLVIQDFCSNAIVVILGSSWPTEEKIAAEFFMKYSSQIPELKFIIAPHELTSGKKAFLEQQFGTTIIDYSNNHADVKDSRILLLDQKGILKFIYRFSHIAFIGGGFGKSVHNTAEASVYGLPVLFGPNYQKFEEAIDFIALDTGFSLSDNSTFERTLLALIEVPENRVAIKYKLEEYFKIQKECSSKIIAAILN